MDKPLQISRRTALKAVPVAATVLVAPDGLLTQESASAASAHFPQPPVWASRLTPGFPRPVLDGTLDVRFNDTYIPGFGTANTRTYNAMIPGPTLRLRGGDRLSLTQINGLPPNPAGPEMHNRPHSFNSFNLHTHGLHVSPAGTADNVFLEFAPRAHDGDPEPQYVSTIDIPQDHPAGTFWYHPHLHGAVTEQVSGGMAGVLIIEGDVDRVPEIAAAAEVVVCINELKLTKKSEVDFNGDPQITAATPVFTVNGVVNPTIFMRPGEVQRWRLVAATAFTRLPLSLTGDPGRHPGMYQIAMDGITFRAPVATETVALSQGNRADVLVRGALPGRYELRAAGVPDPLMTVVVEGEPICPPMDLPKRLPQGKRFISERDVTDPDARREVRFHVDRGVFPDPDFPNAYRLLGTHPTPATDPNKPPNDPTYGLFDPDFVNHTLRLNRVERWTITTDELMASMSHPFHLHTNHFLITHKNGVPLDPPIWQDTLGVAGGSSSDQPADLYTILVEYKDYTGRAVLHCHLLPHEDLGMMQVIDYVDGP